MKKKQLCSKAEMENLFYKYYICVHRPQTEDLLKNTPQTFFILFFLLSLLQHWPLISRKNK